MPRASGLIWTASSSVDWPVRFAGTASGAVFSESPVAEPRIPVDGAGLNDTLASTPLTATITVRSTMDGRSEVLENGVRTGHWTSSMTMQVEVSISVTPNVSMRDAVIKISSLELTLAALGGGTINAGNTLTTVIEDLGPLKTHELAYIGRDGWTAAQNCERVFRRGSQPGKRLDEPEPGDCALRLSSPLGRQLGRRVGEGDVYCSQVEAAFACCRRHLAFVCLGC